MPGSELACDLHELFYMIMKQLVMRVQRPARPRLHPFLACSNVPYVAIGWDRDERKEAADSL